MAKKSTKKETIDLLSKADVLEVLLQEIGRKEAHSSKQAQSAAFIREVDKYIKDQRDVLLIAVKLR